MLETAAEHSPLRKDLFAAERWPHSGGEKDVAMLKVRSCKPPAIFVSAHIVRLIMCLMQVIDKKETGVLLGPRRFLPALFLNQKSFSVPLPSRRRWCAIFRRTLDGVASFRCSKTVILAVAWRNVRGQLLLRMFTQARYS